MRPQSVAIQIKSIGQCTFVSSVYHVTLKNKRMWMKLERVPIQMKATVQDGFHF